MEAIEHYRRQVSRGEPITYATGPAVQPGERPEMQKMANTWRKTRMREKERIIAEVLQTLGGSGDLWALEQITGLKQVTIAHTAAKSRLFRFNKDEREVELVK